MDIIPAVDIRQGKCVRLYQGDYNQETVYSDDPLEVALRWQSLGASRLHIVDLDGASGGEITNVSIIKEIARAVLVPTQLGGGIRRLETVEEALKIGIDRVILGTAAVEDPSLVKETCRRYADAIVVAIDAREGYVATHGWKNQTELKAVEFARAMVNLGARRLIYTDIVRDGTLTEPNFTAIAELIESIRVPVIAAGGISALIHLKILKQIGAEGAILGKALYNGNINLKQAVSAINKL